MSRAGGAEPVVVRARDQIEIDVPVAAAQFRVQAESVKLDPAAVTDRGKHPVASPALLPGGRHHRLLHQRGQRLLDLLLVVGVGADGYGRVKIESVDKHSCLGPQQPLGGATQVEAPLDAGGHRGVPIRCRATAPVEEFPAVRQTRIQLGW